MRSPFIIPSLILGILFHSTGHCQTSVDALRGTSDAAQGVFDRISGNATTKADTVYEACDVYLMAEYPGGIEAFNAFIKENFQYPQAEYDAGIQGEVIVRFVVERDGHVDQARVIRGVSARLDTEAIRVVMAQPPWSPSHVHGKAVATYFQLPIHFIVNSPVSTAPAKD